MGYDGLDRLTSANGKWGAANFTYDTMGNITSKNLGSMAVSYVYDPTTKRLNSASVTGSKSKNYSFTYNKKGAVLNTGSVQLPRNQAGQVTGTSGHTYVYDGSGKRVKDTKNGKHRYSIYDLSGRMIYQWDQQTETITDYIFLGKERVTEAQVSLGNGSQNVDNTNVGYTGHQWDKDSGLNYMQARYYDPLLARFLSNDPVGFRDIHSFNRYVYANNNPYKYTDPDGEIPLVVIAIWLLKEAGGEVFEQVTGVPAPTVKNLSKFAAKKLMRQTLKKRKKVEGVYSFKEGDQDYVGQSKDVLKRLQQHAGKGKLTKDKAGSLKVKEVKGGTQNREVTEQSAVNKLTNDKGAESSKVSNKKNPIGSNRASAMGTRAQQKQESSWLN